MPVTPANDPIIELVGAGFGYAERRVVSDVDLTMHAGEVVALLGPNGSGKSTLVRGLLGLVDQEGGSVRLFGIPRSQFADHTRIGYVPQRHSLSSSVRATVTEIVEVGRLPTARGGNPKDVLTATSCASRSARSVSRTAPTRRSPRSPAGSSGGCSSPGLSRVAPRCSSWTNRRRAWTTRARSRWPRS